MLNEFLIQPCRQTNPVINSSHLDGQTNNFHKKPSSADYPGL